MTLNPWVSLGVALVSSGQFHLTHCDADTCPYPNMFSKTSHWTQAVPLAWNVNKDKH